MLMTPGDVGTWLYTSDFKSRRTPPEIAEMALKFSTKNQRHGLTGFLLTDGESVMQLLEGDPDTVEAFKTIIKADTAHTNVTTEVEALEDQRAYPSWGMRAVAPADYNLLFAEIESAKIGTIATTIATMIFDITFDD